MIFNLAYYREKAGLSQEQLAKLLKVPCQTVNSWENGSSIPDTHYISDAAKALGIPVDELINEQLKEDFDMRERFFDEERMFAYVLSRSTEKGFKGTIEAMNYAREMHKGQYRKNAVSDTRIPYIYHPLSMACHALAMGTEDDDTLSAIMLHDVYEDCGVALSDLPCNERVRNSVRLLSHNTYAGSSKESAPDYYAGIARDPLASLVKCIDRCHNLSSMAQGFTKSRMISYINETEMYIIPILANLSNLDISYSGAQWLLKYQIYSLLEMAKRLI